jgi:hypothetical protein
MLDIVKLRVVLLALPKVPLLTSGTQWPPLAVNALFPMFSLLMPAPQLTFGVSVWPMFTVPEMLQDGFGGRLIVALPEQVLVKVVG